MDKDWDGKTERRAGPDPASLQGEIRATRQDLGRLASAVATLGSDEKLQKAVDSVAQENRRHWQRLIAIIGSAFAVIAVVVMIAALWANDARDAAHAARDASTSAAKVSSYVDHCLVHPSVATPGECGNTTATGQQSATVLALFCFLELPQEARTDPTAQECFRRAAAEAKAASAAATTTTTGSGHHD